MRVGRQHQPASIILGPGPRREAFPLYPGLLELRDGRNAVEVAEGVLIVWWRKGEVYIEVVDSGLAVRKSGSSKRRCTAETRRQPPQLRSRSRKRAPVRYCCSFDATYKSFHEPYLARNVSSPGDRLRRIAPVLERVVISGDDIAELALTSNSSAASRREDPLSTLAITRPRISAE